MRMWTMPISCRNQQKGGKRVGREATRGRRAGRGINRQKCEEEGEREKGRGRRGPLCAEMSLHESKEET